MNYVVINHKEVRNDFVKAKKWYKKHRLDNRFSFEIKKTIEYIIQNPYLFQVKYLSVRVAYSETFPFGIHYLTNENTKTIIILGIFHNAISPEKWLKRM